MHQKYLIRTSYILKMSTIILSFYSKLGLHEGKANRYFWFYIHNICKYIVSKIIGSRTGRNENY